MQIDEEDNLNAEEVPKGETMVQSDGEGEEGAEEEDRDDTGDDEDDSDEE